MSKTDLLQDGSLPRRWTRLWADAPSWPQIRDIDGSWLSSLELEELTRTLAGAMLASGLVPGDRFLTCAPTSVDLVLTYVAALRAGLVVVPVNTAYTLTEVTGIVADARPCGAYVADDEHAEWIRASAGADVVLFGPELTWDQGLPDAPELDRAGVDDAALLVYTSGTTGRPKGARLTHGNLLASATAVREAWGWTPEDRLLLTLPLFHVHGLGVGVNGALSTGASIELRPRFDLDDVLERCGSGRISMFFGVPTMYTRLAGSGRASELSALRLLVSGSAPLPPSVATAIASATGQMPLERYGMTETIMLTTNPLDGERRPGTVGFPFPGVELRLADGAGSEIQVRGPNVISEYYEQPRATAAAFTEDGWFRTGDLGEHDDAGYLKIVGRAKELIISGGFNVYPREVEERLLEFPGVAEVAVIGRPDPDWGEAVTAVVVAVDGAVLDETALRAHAAAGLAPYKTPKRFEFVDALPRNALGKIVRSAL